MWSRSIVLIEPNEETGGCCLKRETIVFPNGLIPQWVINRVAPRKAAQWMENFKKVTASMDPSGFGQRLSLLATRDRGEFARQGR